MRYKATSMMLIGACGTVAQAQDCVWRHIQAAGPGDRIAAGVAYDSTRARTVLFGGYNSGGVFGDTWEWDGQAWSLRSLTGPSPRVSHAMCFDSIRNRVVLFSGRVGINVFRDTWEWDGTTWTQAADGPVMSFNSTMAFDASRNRSVAFGGMSNGATLEWDGDSWTVRQISSPATPAGHTMVYDNHRARIILVTGGTTSANEVWEYNGLAWSLVPPVGAAPTRNSAVAIYDSSRARLVLVGGQYTSTYSPSQTWEWSPATSSWTQRGTGQPSASSSFMTMAWDSKRARGVLVGAAAYPSGTTFWEYNGAGTVHFQLSPPPTSQTVDMFDPAVFSAAAPGATSYQWHRYNQPLSDGGFISGSQTNSLSFSVCTFGTAAGYSVRAEGTCGPVFGLATLAVDPHSCFANCDGSTGNPVLTPNDFECFIDRFAGGHPTANCDGSSSVPSLTANDFQCFINSWVACQ